MSLISKLDDEAEATPNKSDLRNLRARIGASLESTYRTLNPNNLQPFRSITSEEKQSANLFLYDNHFGEDVHLPNGNIYTFDEADSRMDRCFDKTADQIETQGADKFDEVNILIGGDNVDGDGTVYPGQGMHIVDNVFEQMDRYYKAVIRNIARLDKTFGQRMQVNINGIYGNHGTSKTGFMSAVHQSASNYDILTYKFIENYLLGCQKNGQYTNVKMFYDYRSEFLTVPTKGWQYLMLHKMPATLTTPKPKLMSLSNMLNYNAHALVTGHFHETQLSGVGDYKVIRVGSMAGPNSYSDGLGILRNSWEQLLVITSKEELLKSIHLIGPR